MLISISGPDRLQRRDGEAGGDGEGRAGAAGRQENVIWASGKLLPARWAGLSPATGGTLRALNVAEGDKVEAGKLLAELDNGILQSQVEVAKAAVGEAEAARNKLLAGATPTELAQAQADVLAAQSGRCPSAGRPEAGAGGGASSPKHRSPSPRRSTTSLPAGPPPPSGWRPSAGLTWRGWRWSRRSGHTTRCAAIPHIAARPEALALQQATTDYEAAKAAYQVATQGATREQLAVAAGADQRREGAGPGRTCPDAARRGGRQVGPGPGGARPGRARPGQGRRNGRR